MDLPNVQPLEHGHQFFCFRHLDASTVELLVFLGVKKITIRCAVR